MNHTFSLEQKSKTCDLNAVLIMRQCRLDKISKFVEIKSMNQKMKQSEITKELKISSSSLQRYRSERNMISPYRIPRSSTTHTRKEKISNRTEHDLKMTSNDLKMTSNKPIKKKKNKLKRGMPNDNPTQGSVLIEQVFSSPLNG